MVNLERYLTICLGKLPSVQRVEMENDGTLCAQFLDGTWAYVSYQMDDENVNRVDSTQAGE